jgi:RF-1 domain
MVRAHSIHPAALPPESLLAQCEVSRLRRSGPGGQHRNKVETAVAIRHLSAGVKAEANERRSQAENKAVALFRLRVNLALKIRGKIGNREPPSSLWLSRLKSGRIEVSQSHEDFPALLAEALDTISACAADVKVAAESLQSTASQLIKFLRQEPRALQLVNEWREAKNLHRLV